MSRPLTYTERWTAIEAIANGIESAAAVAMSRHGCRCVGCRIEAADSIAWAIGCSLAEYCDMPEEEVAQKLREVS